jgi:hypothetical protein
MDIVPAGGRCWSFPGRLHTSELKPRRTIGIVDRIERNGTVFVHEIKTNKIGYLGNTTPVVGNSLLKPGAELSLDVVDRGDVMVVSAARFLSE